MKDLLKFDFRRLFRSKLFWASIIFTIVTTVLGVVTTFGTEVEYMDEIAGDQLFFFVFVVGIFVPIYALADFKGGMIRNKLSQGYGRFEVYVSNLIVSVSASLIMAVTWIVSFLPVAGIYYGFAIPDSDEFIFEPIYRLWFLIASFLFIAAYAGLCHLFSMVISNRAVVISLIVIGALFLLTFVVPGLMMVGYSSPEIIEETLISEDDDSQIVEYRTVPNPDYREENDPAKLACKAACTIIIPAQYIFIGGFHYPTTYWYMAYDLLIVFINAGLGYLIFKRKEIK